jgi:single-strand DNA-binding protein
MQSLTIAGNVGNVKDIKEVNGDKVLNFSIAVDNGKDKNGEKRDATWFDCALWGKRAESLAPYISKGSKLVVSGRPSARAHEGKAYLGLTVNELTFMGGGAERGATQEQSEQKETPVKSNYQDYDDDSIPF